MSAKRVAQVVDHATLAMRTLADTSETHFGSRHAAANRCQLCRAGNGQQATSLWGHHGGL